MGGVGRYTKSTILGFMRKEPEHKFLDLKHLQVSLRMMTRSISTPRAAVNGMDSETELYYNGLKHEDVIGSMDNGIHHWSKRGGIVGRGVLLDYAPWAEKKGIQYNSMSRHQIFVKDLDKIAKDQGVELRPGDILIAATPEDHYKHVTQGLEHIGVDGNADTVDWLWNHHFSAIAGDAIAWES
ncbi:MAG: hypothetical protein FRX48_04223 [Lasallia pustulata]|uniref:Cyclase n=1 Tax=Lasallia pustulata TaxID=136370 RepID=A0A5M8PRC6_9LECA|nr:MAG: hypothetical protein FRX48_04223 [Lasallia pustulata]